MGVHGAQGGSWRGRGRTTSAMARCCCSTPSRRASLEPLLVCLPSSFFSFLLHLLLLFFESLSISQNQLFCGQTPRCAPAAAKMDIQPPKTPYFRRGARRFRPKTAPFVCHCGSRSESFPCPTWSTNQAPFFSAALLSLSSSGAAAAAMRPGYGCSCGLNVVLVLTFVFLAFYGTPRAAVFGWPRLEYPAGFHFRLPCVPFMAPCPWTPGGCMQP